MKDLTCNDSVLSILAQVIDEMKSQQGDNFSLEKINLAELQRRTGISRQRLRTLKKNGFKNVPVQRKTAVKSSVIDGYSAIIDNLLKQGVTNSSVCFDRISEFGYTGSISTVKRYIKAHSNLVPAKRQLIAPQGSRGHRYRTEPGESFQMDWGFVKVADIYGNEFQAACFAMVCHHCGERYVEFFTNAKQENLFIGMLHAFSYMGIPKYVLTDNMKSVVIKRDSQGHPIWQHDYESFMKTVGFQTKLCKPRHPFTKGRVERLVRYVKDNFLAGRQFWNYSDLNQAALEWCLSKNSKLLASTDSIPEFVHNNVCIENLCTLQDSQEIRFYLCPERRISFDGFVNYEGRRFGVPFSYPKKLARVCRKDELLYIYSSDLSELLAIHDVTWSKRDRYCADQFPPLQPEEFPTAAVTTTIRQIEQESSDLAFEKFNFSKEDAIHD